jgi:hypothetical protein
MSHPIIPFAPRGARSSAPHVTVATRYRSVSDFIHGFCRSVDERHVLIGLSRDHEVGSRLDFTACLSDGRAIFRGRGTVVERVTSRKHPGVVGVKVALELDALADESRTMHRCLLMARQALLLAQAADAAGFDGEVPEYVRGALPRLAAGTQPQARTLPPRRLPEIAEEKTSTMISTAVAGVIFARHAMPSPTMPLSSIADESESEDDQATRLARRQIEVPVPPPVREDVASDSAVPNLFAPADTVRVEALDPSLLRGRAARWSVLLPLLLLLAGAAMLAADVYAFL